MRNILLTTIIAMIPATVMAQSQGAVAKPSEPSEPFIQLPPPVDPTGRPVPLEPKSVTRPVAIASVPEAVKVAGRSDPTPQPVALSTIPVLQHVESAGAKLSNVGVTDGVRTVFAQHGEDFMVFQVTPDGQAAVAGLLMDLSVDQIKSLAGKALTALGAQHGLQSYFLRNGSRFQVFYGTPDGSHLIPGVMWDASGHDITRAELASVPGMLPTVEIGPAAPNAHITPAVATSSSADVTAQLANATYGTAGKISAPELWMFMDPQCSFSIRAMQALQPHVASGRVQLHVIPRSILDGEDNGLSTAHALGLVSMPADQMVTAWETGQIPAGSTAQSGSKLEANMAAAAVNQVRGTPTLFWRKADGSGGRYDGVPTDMEALIGALRS